VTAKPKSDVTQPSHNSFVKILGEINGTCWAQSPANLTGVGLSIKDVDGTYAGNWWNESGWQGSPIFNPVTLYTSSWTYSTLPTWENGVNYLLKPKVQDDLGGVTESTWTISFVFDTNPPDSGITQPIYNQKRKQLNLIQGTAKDTSSPLDVGNVEIRIWDLGQATTEYWDSDNSTWTLESDTWITTSGGAADPGVQASWSWGSSGVSWRDQHKYKIESRSKDSAGNQEASYGWTEFWWDVTEPVSAVSIPQDGDNLNSLTTIEGTASDTYGVSKTEIYIYDETDSVYWDPDTPPYWIGGDPTWSDLA